MDNLSLFKCKNCGDMLDARNAVNGVIECPYCHTPWTVPKKEASPEALKYLHDGNAALDVCKFEDAFTYFQKAAEFDPKEPEAYFGMALAHFKVQYLKDHVNNRLQPICHEITENRFSDNASFLKAVRFATNEQRKEYEKKSEEIDYILAEFYRLKKSDLDYDCFICVKVTDDSTKQLTEDSKDADYIYRLLQEKGYKPFFSERELRNVTGADYEARILYALYMSECMLVVCNNEAYLQTPWVKNEYTRFLKLVNDEEKESDSITIVFNGTPVERLPGRRGKLQGIDFALRNADGKVLDFVEKHTPEAKAKREAALRKKTEEEARRKAEDEERRKAEEERRLAFERQQKEFEERQRQLLEEQRKELERMREQNNAAQTGNLSGSALLEMLRKAQEEEARQKREEEERKRAEEEAHKRAAETKFVCKYCLTTNTGLDEKCHTCGASSINFIPLEKYLREQEIAKAKAEAERLAREKAEAERIAREKAEAERLAREKAEAERLAREKAEAERLARERAEEERRAYLAKYEIRKGVLKKYLANDKTATIPDGVTEIGEGAFLGKKYLTSVEIPSSVTLIGREAFADCIKLLSVNIPSGVEMIVDSAFRGCTQLRSVEISDSVKIIDSSAFSGCHALEFLKVAKENPFYKSEQNCLIENSTNTLMLACKNSVIPEGVTSISRYAFCDDKLKSIKIPSSMDKINFEILRKCSKLENIEVGKANPVYRSEQNCIIEISTNTLVFGCKKSVIPKSVTSIGGEAFYNCKWIDFSSDDWTTTFYTFEIPDNIKSIDDNAFYGCSGLRGVTIPKRFKGGLFKKGLKRIFGNDYKYITFLFT